MNVIAVLVSYYRGESSDPHVGFIYGQRQVTNDLDVRQAERDVVHETLCAIEEAFGHGNIVSVYDPHGENIRILER